MPPLHLSEGGPPAGAGLGDHASHSPLWASHHAGNAGSFGERVGVICLLILVVSFRSLLNGMLMGHSDVAPKYNNFRICACSRVQLFPKYVLEKLSID